MFKNRGFIIPLVLIMVAAPLLAAEVKISALPAATAPAGADEFVINEAGTSKKITLTQMHTDVEIIPSAASAVPLIIEGASAQTASLLEINTSGGSGGNILRIKPDGGLQMDDLTGNSGHRFTNGSGGANDSILYTIAGTSATISSGSGIDNGLTITTAAGPITLSPNSGVVTVGIILAVPPQATAPATCSIGQFYVDTSGAACACSATNTWSNMHTTGTCA